MDRQTIHNLFAALGITNVVDRDNWVSGGCPFAEWDHEEGEDTHPSFGVNLESEMFHCFACGIRGHATMIPTILTHKTGKDYLELRKILSEGGGMFKITAPKTPKEIEPINENILKMFSFLNQKQVPSLTIETVLKWKLRYDPKVDRLIFQIRNSKGELVGIRGRYLGSNDNILRYLSYSELQPSGDPKRFGLWYGMHFPLVPKKYLILVEGERDTIMMSQAGASNVWGAMGASISTSQIDSLKTIQNPLLLFTDNDKAGRQAAYKILSACRGYMPIYIVMDYCGCKDPAELVEKGLLKKALKSVQPIREG